MRRPLTLAAVGLGTALGAERPPFAQAADGEWVAEAEVTLAAAAIDQEADIAPVGDSLLATTTLGLKRSDTFESGLTLGWRAQVRYERDAASRPAFCGRAGRVPGGKCAVSEGVEWRGLTVAGCAIDRARGRSASSSMRTISSRWRLCPYRLKDPGGEAIVARIQALRRYSMRSVRRLCCSAFRRSPPALIPPALASPAPVMTSPAPRSRRAI